MTHTWILDVLADLDAYARKNDLAALSDHLQGARRVATAELSVQAGGVGLVCIEGGAAGRAAQQKCAGGAV